MVTHRSRGPIVTVVALLALSACGDDAPAADDPQDTTPVTSASEPDPTDPTVAPTTDVPEPEPAPTDPPTTPATAPASSTTPPTTPITTPPTPPVTDRDDLDPLVEAALDDLAVAQGRSADEIEVVTFERVTWPDGSLGCPQPGRSYTQALVDGYRVVLSLDGTLHHYHGADTGQPFPCDDPAEPTSGARGDT